jgi:hypothetical protein
VVWLRGVSGLGVLVLLSLIRSGIGVGVGGDVHERLSLSVGMSRFGDWSLHCGLDELRAWILDGLWELISL